MQDLEIAFDIFDLIISIFTNVLMNFILTALLQFITTIIGAVVSVFFSGNTPVTFLVMLTLIIILYKFSTWN